MINKHPPIKNPSDNTAASEASQSPPNVLEKLSMTNASCVAKQDRVGRMLSGIEDLHVRKSNKNVSQLPVASWDDIID